MKSIIEHLSLATQQLGTPIAEAALSAQVLRDKNLHVNYASLAEVLSSHGFDNQLSKRSLNDIPALAVPCVIVLKDEQAAVITHISGSGSLKRYRILQTGNVAQELSYDELNEHYLGYCWFIKPKIAADGRSDLPEYTLPKAWFWKVIARFRSYYYQVILATIVINFLALVSSLYVMQVYDRVIPNKSYETLTALSIGVVIAVLFELITKLIRGHLTDIAGKKADLIISSALFRRVMSLRLAEKPTSAGSYANNLRDFEAVREFMTSASLLAIVDFPFLLLFVSVIGLIGGIKLAIVPFTIIMIVVVVSFIMQRPLSRYINQSMKESSQRQGLAVEAIEGIETLKVNNATNWAQQKWDLFTAKTAAASIKVKDTSNFIVNFAVAMQQLNTVFLVVVGTFLIHSTMPSEQITMGALIASVILSGRALAPLGQIAGLATRYQSAKHALEGVNKIVERPIERAPDRQYITLDTVSGSLNINQAVFTYSKDAPIAVKGVNLTIHAGEKVAILGSIGSGKSTLLKLLAGLYEQQQGNITLDNVDLRQLDPNFLRNQVALLNQSPRLFLGTLRENMDLARSDGYVSSDQDLLNALARFGLDKIIQNHPKGLDMPLGEDGQGLSGGQKQIVALARLTLKQPRVVLLDEPTTGLDPATENLALRALQQWAHDKTMIVVTHRPQVLQMVDRIIIMENGVVAMDDARDVVLQKLIDNERAQQQAAS
ncbi:type I secretion system permease/ATPase [Wielerella bovis]|uniref:type I secretion system permease/ATPase n=1 Tax=Wielerella bovis TaxID=2917790 RepID=UPI0020192DEA|nr:type I secretion system permease/ATPase [Wielerella bovis]MCG7656795.1 type I secretion system permease/ATPase [Wielerella bovis]MCG7659018.1 type I secretion system permease/ATPase [Wielerella bovis]